MSGDEEKNLTQILMNLASDIGDIKEKTGKVEGTVSRNSQLIDSLGQKLGCLEQNCRTCVAEIPAIKQALENHLSSHNRVISFLWLPLVVTVSGIVVALIGHWFLGWF